MSRRLPLVQPSSTDAELVKSSLRADGSRDFVHPADVRGRYDKARRIVFFLLIGIWAALPWIPIRGNPAIFLDIEGRRFFLFGATFNAQDLWLLFFLVTGLGFGLVYLTVLAGRVWCGWACPQTVFLEGLFRPIERWLEGPREARIRRNEGPWTRDKLVRKVIKHAFFVAAALLVSHVFLAYFVSLPGLFRMVQGPPTEHWEAFAWMLGTSAVFYVNFAWFREQTCIGICPYGRMQSVLMDDHSLVVGYDVTRGEPRGKATDPNAGDCVACNRCVVVCPTGIDIRNGLQLDCIACTACIDACDEIMDKLGRPRGLIRYDSQSGLAGQPRKLVRPRTLVLSALLLVGAIVFAFAATKRADFEANLLRLPGAPYVVENGTIRNAFSIHLVNKGGSSATFLIEPEPHAGATVVLPMKQVELGALASTNVPVFVTMPRDVFKGDFPVKLRVSREGGGDARAYTAPFLGPGK